MGIPISSTRTSAEPASGGCTLYRLPPEIREMIFIQAAFLFFEERPANRWLMFSPGMATPGWDVLQLMGERAISSDDSFCAKLERALFGETKLYNECVEARLSISTLVMFHSDLNSSHYPIFGREVPTRALKSIRHIKYFTW